MKKMTATEAKNRFGELLDNAQAGPVAIQKNGRDVAYLISRDDYIAKLRGEYPNPLAMHFHEELMDEFAGSFKKLAE